MTLNVTLAISGSSEVRATIFFVSHVFCVINIKETYFNTVTFTLDLERNDHVTLNVIQLISGSNEARVVICFSF